MVYRQNNYWGIKFSAIFWNVVRVVSIAGPAVLGGLEAIAAALDFSEVMLFLYHFNQLYLTLNQR